MSAYSKYPPILEECLPGVAPRPCFEDSPLPIRWLALSVKQHFCCVCSLFPFFREDEHAILRIFENACSSLAFLQNMHALFISLPRLISSSYTPFDSHRCLTPSKGSRSSSLGSPVRSARCKAVKFNFSFNSPQLRIPRSPLSPCQFTASSPSSSHSCSPYNLRETTHRLHAPSVLSISPFPTQDLCNSSDNSALLPSQNDDVILESIEQRLLASLSQISITAM